MRGVLVLLAAAVNGQAPQSVSDVCVYNDGAFALKWHLKDADTGKTSSESPYYDVGEVRCMKATALGSISTGASIVPVVRALLGKEVTASDTVIYDSGNVSQVTYTCRGTTLDYSCKPGPAPTPAKNVTSNIGDFILGFAEGLGKDIGFAACIQDVNQTYQNIRVIVDFFEHGFNHKAPASIAKAFELIGGMIKDFGNAITVCVKDAAELAAKIKNLAAILSGNVGDIIKIIVQDVVHIYHERRELTDDCKAVVSDWHAGDFKGSGKAVGDIVGVILGGLEQSGMLVV